VPQSPVGQIQGDLLAGRQGTRGQTTGH